MVKNNYNCKFILIQFDIGHCVWGYRYRALNIVQLLGSVLSNKLNF